MALLGYRSICHETFKKERAERVYSNRQFLSAIASVDLAAKRSAEAHLEGTRLAIRDLTRQKQAFENAIHTKDLSRLYGTVFTLAAEIPLAFSSSFAPEYTIDGELLLPEQYGNWNSVGVFCGAIKERNIMGFVGLHDNDEHDISKFFKSLVSVPMNRVGGLSLHLAIEHAENTFFRPSWVSKLLPEIREELLSRFASGIPGEPNSRKANLVGQFDVINVSASQRDDFYP
ncbi:hypothetical protein C1J02_17060 [Sulfitobacter sp. SK011]|nr:hypothetical protein C1J02_17060 [Sulfitobacter sp. SK011]